MIRIIAKNVEKKIKKLVVGYVKVSVLENNIIVTVINSSNAYQWVFSANSTDYIMGNYSSDIITESFMRDYQREIRKKFFK